MARRRPRVMQSFRAPRPTTNPYIVMLDRELGARDEIEHLRFSWPVALLTPVDVLHLHWPETLLGGDRPWKRVGKRMLMRALLAKLAMTGGTIVRTAHNIELPKDVDDATRRLLTTIEERADHRILLNPSTTLPWPSPTTVIPHGHYVDWFADVPPVESEPDTLGFVGLVRRYKGVETLIDAFAETAGTRPGLRLRISGNPTSADLAGELRTLAAADDRIALDLRFLTEADFATAMMRALGIVLPYRLMHNSGTVLAALSVGRPVLVPRNEVNEALAEEVGPGWIHVFDGSLGPDDLIAFRDALATAPADPPRLSQRDWSRTAVEHVRAYHAARGARRARCSWSGQLARAASMPRISRNHLTDAAKRNSVESTKIAP